MSIAVRRIAPTEWAQYKSIRLRALADSPDAFASTLQTEQERNDEIWSQRLQTAAASGADLPLFAVVDENPVGLVWAKAENSNAAVINVFQMWVDPGFRGRGIGRLLLQAALAWSRERGAQEVLLGVTEADSPALRLYHSAGFEIVGAPEPLREGSDLLSRNMRLRLGTA